MNQKQRTLSYLTLFTAAWLLNSHFCNWHDGTHVDSIAGIFDLVSITARGGNRMYLEYSVNSKSTHTRPGDRSPERNRDPGRIFAPYTPREREYSSDKITGEIMIEDTDQADSRALLLGVILPMLLLSTTGLIFLSGKSKGSLPPEDNRETIRPDKEDALAYRRRGGVWLKKGELNQAIDDFNRAILLNPEEAKAYLGRGIVWAEKGEWNKAIADYSEATRLDPTYTLAYNKRSIAYRKIGYSSKAKLDEQKASELEPIEQ